MEREHYSSVSAIREWERLAMGGKGTRLGNCASLNNINLSLVIRSKLPLFCR